MKKDEAPIRFGASSCAVRRFDYRTPIAGNPFGPDSRGALRALRTELFRVAFARETLLRPLRADFLAAICVTSSCIVVVACSRPDPRLSDLKSI